MQNVNFNAISTPFIRRHNLQHTYNSLKKTAPKQKSIIQVSQSGVRNWHLNESGPYDESGPYYMCTWSIISRVERYIWASGATT